MKLEKVKRKIADGYSDGEIANMSGMSIEEVASLRAPVVVEAPIKKVITPAQVKKASAVKKVEKTTKK